MTTPLGKKTFAEYKRAIRDAKVELEKARVNKIELTLAGDLTNLGKGLTAILNKGDTVYDEAFKAEGEARKVLQDLSGSADELKSAAKLLQSQIDEGFDKLNEAEDSAKDLGVAAKDIPGFISVYDVIYEAEDAVTNYEQLADDIEDLMG